MRTKLLVALCAAVVGACISCDNTIYRIEMTPHDDQMSRQLDMTRNGASSAPVTRPVGSAATQPYEGAFPAEMVQHMAGQYSQSRQTAANEVVFLGDFRNELPEDVGNLGHYQVFTDSMGTANVYLEQFRGQSNQVSNAQRVLESAGMLADLVTVYLRQNLSRDPAWPEFDRFLNKGFRDDMRDLAVDMYIVRAAGIINPDSELLDRDKWLMTRAWQFLIEHGYSTLDDLPAFKAMDNDNAFGPSIFQRILGRKMGIPADQWEKRLAFLGHTAKVGESFLASVQSQDTYRKWKERKLAASQAASQPAGHVYTMEPAASQPSESDLKQEAFVGELANVIMFSPTYPTPDALELTLSLPDKPVQTNGNWDNDVAKVKWKAALPVGTNLPLPTICFAAWSEPNANFQKQHFDRLVLRGEDLYEYVLWTKTLSPDNAKQWRQFLDGIEPDNALKKLESFRFRDDAKMTAATPSQPATLPAGKAAPWTKKIVENINKAQQVPAYERTLE